MALNVATKRRGDPSQIQLGEIGKLIVTDTTAVTAKNIAIIHALTDTVFASMVDETVDGATTMAGLTLKQGDRYYGVITAFTLTSGSVIAYYR